MKMCSWPLLQELVLSNTASCISPVLNGSNGIRAGVYSLRPEDVLLIKVMGGPSSQGPLASAGAQAGFRIQHRGQIPWARYAIVTGKNTGMT